MRELLSKSFWGYVLGGFTFLALVAYSYMVGLHNADTYFHLRAGSELYEGNWSPGDMGPFNKFDSADFVSTQWASQWLMGWVHSLGGLRAVHLLQTILFVGLAYGVYFITRSYASPLVSSLLTAGFLWADFTYLSMRPQLVSFFFIYLVIHLWLRAREKGKYPWVVLAVMLIWPNFHGMWIAGLMNIFALSFAWALEEKKAFSKIWLVALGSALATLLNPIGLKLWLGAIHITQYGTTQGFNEWAPPNYGDRYGFVAFILFAGAAVLLPFLKQDWTTKAILFMALGWAIWSTRSVPFAVVTVLPLIGMATSHLIPRKPMGKAEGWGMAGLAVLAVGLFLAVWPQHPANNLYAPPWAEEVLAELEPGDAVYTDFNVGAWSLYSHPELNVLMHGYADAFTLQESQRNFTLMDLKGGWQTALQDLGAKTVILPSEGSYAYAVESEGWTKVRDEASYVLLTPPADWFERDYTKEKQW